MKRQNIFKYVVYFLGCISAVAFLVTVNTNFKSSNPNNTRFIYTRNSINPANNKLSLIVRKTTSQQSANSSTILEPIFDFEGFDNQKGHKSPIIPNIVHLIFYQTKEISFTQAINIFSIYFNHNPDQIYIHCESECLFTGIYWDQIRSASNLHNKLQFYRFDDKTTIFGQEFKSEQQKLAYKKKNLYFFSIFM